MRPGDVLNQVGAIARHSITQAVRMRIVLVLGVFLVVLVPALPFLLKSDNTLDGQIRMVVTYSLYVIGFLLSVITLFLSVAALNMEIKGRHIFLLDPKPIHRFTLLVGKWLGVMAIDLVLLAAMLGVTYGLVRWLGRPPRPVDVEALGAQLREAGVPSDAVARFAKAQRVMFTGSMEPKEKIAFEESAQAVAKELSANPRNRAVLTRFGNAVELTDSVATNYQNTKAQILTARIGLNPELPPQRQWVDEYVAMLIETKRMPPDRTEAWVRQELYKAFSRQAWQVSPNGGSQTWRIRGIPKFDGWLVIRFRFFRDKGDFDREIPCRFVITGKDGQETIVERLFRVDKQHTFSVRSSLVRADGTLDIQFVNEDSGEGAVVAMFPFQNGVLVLCPAGSMAGNFVRAGLVVLAKLSFLAILGVFASTFVSFPVGVFMTTVVFFAAHMREYFMTEILGSFYLFGTSQVAPGTPLNPGDEVLRYALHYFFGIFPDFSGYDIVQWLSDGFRIEWGMPLHCFFSFVLVRGGVLAVAAWLIFRRRELAALTPQS